MFWKIHMKATIRKPLLVSCVPQSMANLTPSNQQGCPWLCGAAIAGAAGQDWCVWAEEALDLDLLPLAVNTPPVQAVP